MSSPTDPPPTADPPARAQPATREIPVVAPAAPAQQLPPHPGATTPAPVQTVRPTGPVGYPAGQPGPLPPPPPPTSAAGTSSWPSSPDTGPVPLAPEPLAPEPPPEPPAPVVRDRSALRCLGLVATSLVLLQLGLGLRFGGESFWAEIPLWSAFATVCAVLGLAGSAPLLPGDRRPSATTAWRIAAGGLLGLAVFWLLVVLPVVASDRGFLLTAALGCLGAALWTGPARRG